jgi:hypothetical protein
VKRPVAVQTVRFYKREALKHRLDAWSRVGEVSQNEVCLTAIAKYLNELEEKYPDTAKLVTEMMKHDASN